MPCAILGVALIKLLLQRRYHFVSPRRTNTPLNRQPGHAVVVAAVSWLTSWCCQCQTSVSLVALPPSEDLLFCAKHFFVAARTACMGCKSSRRRRGQREVPELVRERWPQTGQGGVPARRYGFHPRCRHRGGAACRQRSAAAGAAPSAAECRPATRECRPRLRRVLCPQTDALRSAGAPRRSPATALPPPE